MVEHVRFDGTWERPMVEHGVLTRWHWKVICPHGIDEKFRMGDRVDISSFVVIFAHHGVTLEDEVQIGPFSSIISLDTISGKSGPVVMKRGACVGSHCTVMPGVTIGENAIVGAHSLVTRDIPPNTISVGVPARVVRMRSGSLGL